MKTTLLDADLPVIPTLLHGIRANTSDDAFLGDVLQAVLDSDDNFYRDFFLDDNRVLCFLRTEECGGTGVRIFQRGSFALGTRR